MHPGIGFVPEAVEQRPTWGRFHQVKERPAETVTVIFTIRKEGDEGARFLIGKGRDYSFHCVLPLRNPRNLGIGRWQAALR